MKKITGLKVNKKILIIPVTVALVVIALFFSTRTSSGEGALSEAMEGGESTLTSVGRNYDSLIQFVQNNETQSRQLLESARVELETAEAKLDSARHSDDEYVVGMVDNYRKVAQASNVMAKGVDNLLFISENLTNAIYYYSQNNFEEAAKQASYCLEVLTPLLKDLETSNSTLNNVNKFYIASIHRERLTVATEQHRNETEIYNQYVKLLQSILEGKAYLQMNEQLEEYMRQLQSAIANKDYETAKALLQKISEILKKLQDPQYQDAAGLASQLDPSWLSGSASDTAEELKNRLRNLEGLDAFETYLKSLQKYLEALENLQNGNVSEAEQAINEGLGLLGSSQGGDPELQGLYAGLRDAFNTLQLRIRNPPPPG